MLSIQILQYEFLGPIKLQEWGPPMEKVVYLIMTREKDSFNIIYAGECEKTTENNFFTNNPSFKCWIESHSNASLYLAILPMFESENYARNKVLNQVIARYHPKCNERKPEPKPEYKIRSKHDSETSSIIPCPCCGSEMKVEKELENTTIIRCTECGISDTRLNS